MYEREFYIQVYLKSFFPRTRLVRSGSLASLSLSLLFVSRSSLTISAFLDSARTVLGSASLYQTFLPSPPLPTPPTPPPASPSTTPPTTSPTPPPTPPPTPTPIPPPFPPPPPPPLPPLPSQASNIPCILMLFGLSIGNPSARSQITCAMGPRARLTPKMTV